MSKISDVLTERNWFKGVYPAELAAPRVAAGGYPHHCLGTAVGFYALTSMMFSGWNPKLTTLAQIILRLFPGRIVPEQLDLSSFPSYGGELGKLDAAIVVAFNNHCDTTWEEIEKVMHTFEIEEENIV